MEPVLFYGAEKERETETVVARAVAAAGGRAVSVSEKTVAVGGEEGKSPEFLLLRFETVPAVAAARGILVLKQELPPASPRLPQLPEGFIAVADSANTQAAELLRRLGVPAVICGMSQKDSVTFSSFGADSAVVSVQRELRTLRGGTVEPREIPVVFAPPPPAGYPLLAAVTVLLLGEAPVPSPLCL